MKSNGNNKEYEILTINGSPELIVYYQSSNGLSEGCIIFVHGILKSL